MHARVRTARRTCNSTRQLLQPLQVITGTALLEPSLEVLLREISRRRIYTTSRRVDFNIVCIRAYVYASIRDVHTNGIQCVRLL